MKTIRERLESLTPDQCVEIAKLLVPDVDWVFLPCDRHPHWSGFDLVDKESEFATESPFFQHCFQIDYSDTDKQRFRYYDEGCNEYHLDASPAYDYLRSLPD
jgi:hypothetical protein